jgi:hypothetical protein
MSLIDTFLTLKPTVIISTGPSGMYQAQGGRRELTVVSGETLGDLLVVHLDRLDFGGHVGGGEGDNHTLNISLTQDPLPNPSMICPTQTERRKKTYSLDDTCLNTTDGHRTDTADLVDILEGETEGLVGGTRWGLNGIDGLEKRLTLGGTSLGLLGPSLVPGHVGRLLQH